TPTTTARPTCGPLTPTATARPTCSSSTPTVTARSTSRWSTSTRTVLRTWWSTATAATPPRSEPASLPPAESADRGRHQYGQGAGADRAADPEPAGGGRGTRGVRVRVAVGLQPLPDREYLRPPLRYPWRAAAQVEGESGLGVLELLDRVRQLAPAPREREPARGQPGTAGGQGGQLPYRGHLRFADELAQVEP